MQVPALYWTARSLSLPFTREWEWPPVRRVTADSGAVLLVLRGVGFLVVMLVVVLPGVPVVRLARRVATCVVALVRVALTAGMALATLVLAVLLVVFAAALVVLGPALVAAGLAVMVQALLSAGGATLLALLVLLLPVLVLTLCVVAALL